MKQPPRLTAAAASAGLSKSRWVAQLIRRYPGDEWPPDCRELAGAFPDFPLRDTASDAALPPDTARLGF
ncbi:MAG: hypothetical protein KF778_01320 [Rhodocyclaceae bacterium]|nr:hypothetical protein [Rhodocyclaceae bacterium]MBX3667014.1 hypothetical protein [Rhodocyclaceae bacterium]